MPEFDLTDRVFGPPCAMGAPKGYANMSCRRCEVGWSSQLGENRCWVCGMIGDFKSMGFAGSSCRFPDEPPPQYRRDAA